ncbi:MAG: VacJ family lipoprotein [Alphaproteobacteria bacterium]|nr:VacJ family lipoprotein [Alphaproteobacteria bacterium]
MKFRFIPLFLLAACASSPEDPDPHKCFNKAMLEVNLSLDENILKPASHVYEDVTNEPVRLMFSNFFDNLKEPFYLVNYTVQTDGENMASSFFRFLINSTFGFFGLFDMAELLGVPKHSTGYKDTLHKMEVPHGDYIVLPVFGFSSTRDTIAEPISWFADPVSYFIGWPLAVSKAALQMVIDRSENSEMIDSMISESEDLYSKTRSMYLQKYGVGDDVPFAEDGPSPDDEAE